MGLRLARVVEKKSVDLHASIDHIHLIDFYQSLILYQTL